MNDYIIMTDSCSDMPLAMVSELGVEVMPLKFTIGGNTYTNYSDNRDMPIKEFYSRLRNGEQSKTSQINPDEFTSYFEPHLKEGKDILYIAFSSALSGTYKSSLIAAEDLKEKYPERRIECFDSLCACIGQTAFVWYVANMKKSGYDMNEVLDWLNANRLHLCHWFTVEDLMHLKRGGRISAATAIAGTMLKIKPILHVDDEGRLINVGKVRGRKASLDAIVDKAGETGIDISNQTVFISHGDCEDEAEYVAEQLRKKYGVKNIVIDFIGPVIGAHAGPGTMAVYFLGTQR
ncbi:MAG: DegV family protein [Clostridia bacterium]|nr:DegV family protein [Clostridia bacterium]